MTKNNKKQQNRPNRNDSSRTLSLYRQPIMPMRIRRTLNCSWFGFFNAATGGNYPFTVYGNTLYQPFSTATPITSVGASNGTGVAITNQFNGAPNLELFYNSYKILHSRLKVTMSPQNAADAGLLVGCVTANSLPGLTVSIIKEQPFSADRLISLAGTQSRNTVTIDNPCPRTTGLTPRQYDALPYINNANLPPSETATNFYVMFQTSNNTTNVAPIAVMMDLEVLVEFNDYVPQS